MIGINSENWKIKLRSKISCQLSHTINRNGCPQIYQFLYSYNIPSILLLSIILRVRMSYKTSYITYNWENVFWWTIFVYKLIFVRFLSNFIVLYAFQWHSIFAVLYNMYSMMDKAIYSCTCRGNKDFRVFMYAP